MSYSLQVLPIKTEHLESARIFFDTLPNMPLIPLNPRHPTATRSAPNFSDAFIISFEGSPTCKITFTF